MNKTLLNKTILILLAVLITACGGGGSSTSDESSTDTDTQASNSISINWETPTSRDNNTSLTKSEILGYALLIIGEEELADFQTDNFTGLTTIEDFIDQPNIAKYLPSFYISYLLEISSPNLIMLNNNELNSYTFENLEPDTYYFAISAFDQGYNYAQLSNTVKATIN